MLHYAMLFDISQLLHNSEFIQGDIYLAAADIAIDHYPLNDYNCYNTAANKLHICGNF